MKDNINEEESEQKIIKLEEAAAPLMKYLSENHHPHTMVIVTNTEAEVLEGILATRHILKYIKH